MTGKGSTTKEGAPQGAAWPTPWLFRRLNQRYRAQTGARLSDAGFGDLPQPGYWALTALDRGVREASTLVGEMGVSKQAVSKLVDVLVSAGYVERRPNQIDRRRTELVLTVKGQEAADVIASSVRATEQAFMAKLGTKSFAQLVHMLDHLLHEET